MAGVTPWMLATLGLAAPAGAALLCAGRGSTVFRLAALQLGTSLSAMVLALMCFAFDQPSFMDLALTLVLLSLPGTLVIALFLERWL